MKRGFENGEIAERLAMANCLMLLSHSHETKKPEVFECKTCNRQFPSFQALGGHRASHKRPRLLAEKINGESKPLKPKLHECSICGQKFSVGQALGGHMRRHRVTMNENFNYAAVISKEPLLRRSNSRRDFGLDLNLTPLENDLKLYMNRIY